MTTPELLKLRAEDKDDLAVISAYLQDAVVRRGDLAYLRKGRRFALLANRYCWECDAGVKAPAPRVRTGLHFENVLSAKSAHVRQGHPDAVMELLAIRYSEGEKARGRIDLLFAGGGCIRLEVECIDASLRDLAGPWPAKGRPSHVLEKG